jgi:hypothetical protein
MASQQKFIVELSKKYNEDELTAISQEIIDYVIKRTQEGKGIGSKPWSGNASVYSKAYENSLDFKIAGKKKGQVVNLTLSGDMLSLLDTLSVNKGKIVIGYPSGDSVNGKVEGNVKGTYGQKSPIPGKARNFMGITKTELREILSKYPLNDDEKRSDRTDQVLTAIEEATTYQDEVLAEES